MGIIIGALVVFCLICLLVIKCSDEVIKNENKKMAQIVGQEEADRITRETIKRANEELEFGKGYGIKCPNCGQVNVKKISTTSRAVSVGVAGLASDKIGKTYKCPKCGYMW